MVLLVMTPVARQRREPTPLACLLLGCRCRPSCLLASLRPLVTQVHSTVRRQRTCVHLFACSSLGCSKCSTRAKCGVPNTHSRSRGTTESAAAELHSSIRVVRHTRSRETAWWSRRRGTQCCKGTHLIEIILLVKIRSLPPGHAVFSTPPAMDTGTPHDDVGPPFKRSLKSLFSSISTVHSHHLSLFLLILLNFILCCICLWLRAQRSKPCVVIIGVFYEHYRYTALPFFDVVQRTCVPAQNMCPRIVLHVRKPPPCVGELSSRKTRPYWR